MWQLLVRTCVLLAAALLLSATANALSPVGLPWSGWQPQQVAQAATADGITVVDAEEVRALLDAGEAIVFDARSAVHHLAGSAGFYWRI